MKNMKKRTNNMEALRKILGQTQEEFAAMIGISRDAVASWECGRNALSAGYARRIAHATGVSPQSLLGTGPLWVHLAQPRRPYTAAEFQQHRKHYWGDSDQKSALRQLGPGTDALELLFRAAARAGEGGKTLPLPAVVDSFVHWCRQTEEDFKLLKHIEAQLETRKRTVTLTKTYKQWREERVTNPGTPHLFGFKDDPKKGDTESLTLSKEMYPVWAPGWDMRGGKR
ncbi:MAG: helix-turn-helix transcriptional regulator [Verrucomicrobia bacterium]|jgi:transcriptional regulator with XRE-family HTH domain|nr:helix-turn-helix transcriptional regulator [Verrucomicrobiota bacterium]